MNILVADDEFYARKAIVKMLSTCAPEVHVVGDVETGREVIAFLENGDIPVDAVFTDIKMPEMDGLQLSGWLCEHRPDIFTVIITGYADFEYARRAISFRVNHYITKPVDREELEGAVREIEEKLRVRAIREKEVEARLFELSRAQLSFEEIVRSEALVTSFFPYDPQALNTGVWRILLLQTSRSTSAEERQALRASVTGALGLNSTQLLYLHAHDELLALIFEESQGGAESAMRRVIRQCGEALCVSASEAHTGRDALLGAYKEAVYAMHMRLIDSGRIHIYSAGMHRVSAGNSAAEAALQAAVDLRDMDGVKRCIHNALFAGDLSSVALLQKRLTRMLKILDEAHETEDDAAPKKEYLLLSHRDDLYSFRTMEQVESYFTSLAEMICGGSMGKPDVISDILRYIERNYSYDISLQELAEEKYFMNASYLSRLFKTQVGKTFSKYLIEFRLQKSTELLRETILKISDIASHVGYNDVSHFIHSFKKAYDMTPEEYRAGYRAQP